MQGAFITIIGFCEEWYNREFLYEELCPRMFCRRNMLYECLLSMERRKERDCMEELVWICFSSLETNFNVQKWNFSWKQWQKKNVTTISLTHKKVYSSLAKQSANFNPKLFSGYTVFEFVERGKFRKNIKEVSDIHQLMSRTWLWYIHFHLSNLITLWLKNMFK